MVERRVYRSLIQRFSTHVFTSSSTNHHSQYFFPFSLLHCQNSSSLHRLFFTESPLPQYNIIIILFLPPFLFLLSIGPQNGSFSFPAPTPSGRLMTDWISRPHILLLAFSHFVITIVIAKMASSQVEIAASSPFGCAAVHNRRDPFQKNLNKFVASCNDTSRRIDLDDLWVHQPQWQTTTAAATNKCSSGNNPNRNNKNNNSNNNKEHAIDYRDVKIEAETRTNRWARAREMIFPLDHCDSTKGSGGRSVGVSSLVQKWSSFETDAKVSSRSNGGATTMDNEAAEAAMDPFGDWEPARTAFSAPASSRGRDSDATESERLRVADIIKKLTDDRLNDVGGCESPPRARTPSPLDQLQTEQRCSAPVLSSPRIRGRQAYNDVLMQMERDRQKELQGLVGRKAVSKFSHRGRIQVTPSDHFLVVIAY